MSKPYIIAPDGKSITCHICDKTSYNLNDVKHRYCGYCHVFLDDFEECAQCGASGFDTPGTGYGNVCTHCGGLKYVRKPIEPPPAAKAAGYTHLVFKW